MSITKKLTQCGFPLRHSVFRIPDSTCQEWSLRYSRIKPLIEKGGTYFFIGIRGSGKTQMATTLGGYMLTKKKTVRYIKAFDIFNGIVESFTERTGFVSPLIKCDYLVIDSMELRKGSEFENRELNNIIDKRYDGLTKTTIIISNDTEHSIQAFLGSSAWSRASQCGGSIIFDGKCFRERG